MTQQDCYEEFLNASDENRRLLLQEELILDVTEAIATEMERQGLRNKDLAEKLGKSKGYISQLTGGGRNLTLRTISDVADALGCKPVFQFGNKTSKSAKRPEPVSLLRHRTAAEQDDESDGVDIASVGS